MSSKRDPNDPWARVHITKALIAAMEATWPPAIHSKGTPISDLNAANFALGQGDVTAKLKAKWLQQQSQKDSDNSDDE